MKIKLKNTNDYTKELKCTVPWSDLEQSFIDEFNKYKSNHTPKGGRKGKVSGVNLEIFKRNYSASIEASFAEKSLNEYYRKALEQENLNPINQANVSNLDFSEGNDLEFTLTFEMIPEVKLPSYKKKFKINMIKFIPSDEDMELSLEELRQQHSNIKTIDSGAKSGDFIMGDFQELDDSDVPIIGKKLEKQYIKLGIGAFTGDAEKKLIGVKIDDKRKVEINYGEGKQVKYEIHIHKVEEQILPELDDNFALSVSSDLKTLDALKDKVKENIQRSIDDDYEKRKRDAYIDYFINKIKFSAPQSMVNRYLEKLLEEQLKKDNNLDKDKFRDEAKKGAEYNVKWFIIKDAIIRDGGVSFNNDDLNNELNKIVKESHEEEQKIRDYFANEQNRESLASNMMNQKLFDYIDQFATIKDKEQSTSELRKQNKGQ